MRKFFVVLLALTTFDAAAQTPQEKYIEQYAPLAVKEMQRSGVPASITLAQGLLESGAGLSALAKEGNNHFGIKCHKGWTGKTMYLDDDERGECFRVYDTPEESFRDHSDFLRYRDRYKFLFDLEPTDYTAWAYGLKQAGYATDPKYPAKLIKYIQEYDLSRFDALSQEEKAALPAPPHRIETPVAASAKVAEQFRFSLSRTLYSLNGVPFLYSAQGESYASIARAHHLFLKEILRYNDLKAEEPLSPGTVVYLSAKKSKTPPGLEQHIVETDGEDFHAICQRYAVREKAIRRLNGFGENPQLREGDQIKLR